MADSRHVSVGQARYYHDKKAFVNAQVRLLEDPITPPPDWRRHRARFNDKGQPHKPLPDTVVSAALSRLHASSKKASRLSFNSQSIRQILEQLEANQYEMRRKAKQGGIIIRTRSIQEILNSDWIDAFPETWQHHQDEMTGEGSSASSASASTSVAATPSSSRLQKYADLRSRIVALQARYQNLKEKHEYYTTLQSEIQRLDTGEIQKTVLSPDSQVVQELEKMKVLLPKLISILNTRRDVLSAKRKYQTLTEGSDTDVDKRQRVQPSNPRDALMDLF
ncbi:hypothetical protein BGZ99_002744 [Dissophora globulifera]|uniref:Uncharacterized protein n=1 Tax=Dissophora globulifera TaxID=979702 RepID=A0A9P6UX23_9FUNG|nr:hypothetical protein BGZ99_002744 [Dissophora globulifera]